MATKSEKVPIPEAGLEAGNGAAPAMKILGQYLKDMSFENPNAPQSLSSHDSPPQIEVSVNVNVRTIGEGDYEVELQLAVKAVGEETAVFLAEMEYAGIFRLENIPEEHIRPVILIECPRMLFPFARHILADAIRNGGFPPLMLDPIDFAAMYQQRMQEEEDAEADADADAGGKGMA